MLYSFNSLYIWMKSKYAVLFVFSHGRRQQTGYLTALCRTGKQQVSRESLLCSEAIETWSTEKQEETELQAVFNYDDLVMVKLDFLLTDSCKWICTEQRNREERMWIYTQEGWTWVWGLVDNRKTKKYLPVLLFPLVTCLLKQSIYISCRWWLQHISSFPVIS